MTEAAVLDEPVRLCDSLFKGLRLVHCKDGRELLVRELLGEVDRFYLADQNLAACRRRKAGELCDLACALTDNLRVERAVDDDGLSDLVCLFGRKEVSAALLHFRLELVVNVCKDDGRLLGSADHAVIKGLGMKDGRSGKFDVRGRIDDRGRVACADADCGFAGGICRLDHAGTARRKDHIRLSHDHTGKRNSGLIDPADDILGSACRNGSIKYDLCRSDGASLCTRVRRNDETVSRLKADERLEDRCGRGVGRGNDCRQDADRLSDTGDSEALVALDHAAGLGILILIVDILRCVVVLDDLVLDDAHARLLHCHLCKRDTHLVCRKRRAIEDLVDLLLRIGSKLLLCRSDLREHLGERLFIVDDEILHNRPP